MRNTNRVHLSVCRLPPTTTYCAITIILDTFTPSNANILMGELEKRLLQNTVNKSSILEVHTRHLHCLEWHWIAAAAALTWNKNLPPKYTVCRTVAQWASVIPWHHSHPQWNLSSAPTYGRNPHILTNTSYHWVATQDIAWAPSLSGKKICFRNQDF